MELYNYRVFGLNMRSEIRVPELTAGKGKPDVKIILGPVSIEDNKRLNYTNYYRLSKSEFKFDVKNVAKYCIKNGDSIVVEPYRGADLEAVKVYLMGTGMGVLLIQREIAAIHGSCIDIKGKAIILTGQCGAGKSTLSTALLKNGCGFLADDISVVSFSAEGLPVVQPAFARQRLCRDAAERLDYDPDTLPLASMEDQKYMINTGDCFRMDALPLKAVIEITTKKAGWAELIKVTGIDRIKLIQNNIYCGILYKTLGLGQNYIRQIIDIAKNVPVYHLFRPEGEFTVDEQMKLVFRALRLCP